MPSVTTVSSENLAKYRYHTGAQPTPLAPDEPCPPLFRDIGPAAMTRFLQGGLTRLCGPVAPITYLRTGQYQEPYIDHGRIGRIMLLQPHRLNVWQSGLEAIFIAPRETLIDFSAMVFVPAEIPLISAATQYADVRCLDEFVEALGPQTYGAAISETQERLTELQSTHAETERLAAPLRRMFQSMDQRDRERAHEWMQRSSLSESDLCTAWHHLPDERRRHILAQLLEMREVPA